jgi:hypothetical protein
VVNSDIDSDDLSARFEKFKNVVKKIKKYKIVKSDSEGFSSPLVEVYDNFVDKNYFTTFDEYGNFISFEDILDLMKKGNDNVKYEECENSREKYYLPLKSYVMDGICVNNVTGFF